MKVDAVETSQNNAAQPSGAGSLSIGVLGGDRRVLEIMRQFVKIRTHIRIFGCAPGAEEIVGHASSATVMEAVAGADLILGPLPGIGVDESFYAPFSDKPVMLTPECMRAAKKGAIVIVGRATPFIRGKATEAGLKVFDIGPDDALAIRHATPTAEGAIRIAIEKTEHTLHSSKILVTGLGRVGLTMAHLLDGLKAKVFLAVRSESQIARAEEMGFTPVPLNTMVSVLPEMDVIINTIPSVVFDRTALAAVRKNALIIDLASPPGGIDFPAGKELGLEVVWARGQAGSAPRTSGYNEWLAIQNVLTSEGLLKAR
jgi:dipicolinate synthase subunit A